MRDHNYYVYILSSLSRTLYTGVTNNLRRRMSEHRAGKGSVFAARYHINRLVHYERFGDIRYAIAREKEIKNLLREKKMQLIESINAGWIDLAENWFKEPIA